MELYLTKDQIMNFAQVRVFGVEAKGLGSAFLVNLEPAAPEDEDSKEYCKMITMKSTGTGLTGVPELDSNWTATLYLPTSPSDGGTINMGSGLNPKPSIVGVLASLFEAKNLSFHMEMKDLELKYSCGCVTKVKLEANDWTLEDFLGCENEEVSFKKVKFPEHELHPEATMDNLHPSQCHMTLTVKISEDGLAKVPLPPKIPLAESDLVIVAANGAEVKCHKSRLIESCDAFQELIDSQMKDGIISRLEMLDTTEAGVRGLLSFIYNSDLEATSEECDVALELFRAGDKYRMFELRYKMKTLICSKSPEWFSVDMAVRMILLVQDMEEKEEIFKKMAEVLKWYCKNSPADWLASEELGKLIRNHPQLAIRFS